MTLHNLFESRKDQSREKGGRKLISNRKVAAIFVTRNYPKKLTKDDRQSRVISHFLDFPTL